MKYRVHAKVVVPDMGTLDYDGVTIDADERLRVAVEVALKKLVLTGEELRFPYDNGLSLSGHGNLKRVSETVGTVDRLTEEATGTPDEEFRESCHLDEITLIDDMNVRRVFNLGTGLSGFNGIHVTSYEVTPIATGGCSELLLN